mgnify:CR=1 FL=1
MAMLSVQGARWGNFFGDNYLFDSPVPADFPKLIFNVILVLAAFEEITT